MKKRPAKPHGPQIERAAPPEERIIAWQNEHSKSSSPEQLGQEIVNQLDRLAELSTREDPEDVGRVVDRIVNHLAKILQRLNTEGSDGLRQVAQERMVYSARRLSDIAFDALKTAPNKASEVMVLSLVKLIAGQCENLKRACNDNPKVFRWIAEQNVFWPSIRALYETYRDDFPETKELLHLGAGLPINPEPKRAPDLNKAACQEVFRFLGQVQNVVFPPLPTPSETEKPLPAWGKLFAMPPLPAPSTEPETLAAWKERLSLYLEEHKERLIASPDFQYARDAEKSQRKLDNTSLIWDRIKNDCTQVLATILSR